MPVNLCQWKVIRKVLYSFGKDTKRYHKSFPKAAKKGVFTIAYSI